MDQKYFLSKVFGDVDKDFRDTISYLKSNNDQASANTLEKSKYSIFYSNPFYTLKEGPIYFLGLNPGGNESIQYDDELLDDYDLDTNGKKAAKDWSAYTKECWKDVKNRLPHIPECPLVPHQERVINILERSLKTLDKKDQHVADVFATNLYFFRSANAKILGKYKLFDCWKYHEKFLELVNPKVIICNGNGEGFSAFSEIRRKLSGKMKESESVPIYGTFSLKSFVIPDSPWSKSAVRVIGIPHVSRFAPNEDFFRKLDNLIKQTRQP